MVADMCLSSEHSKLTSGYWNLEILTVKIPNLKKKTKKKRFTGNENHFATFPMVWIKKTGL